LNPRIKAIKMSITSLSVMMLAEMSQYRYQLDLGGAGCTTWTGTLEKLVMPGLLFHHVTPATDWFYPQPIAWKYFVAVRADLEDLRERFEWAEGRPEEAERIAQAGTAFARNFISRVEVRSINTSTTFRIS
jgi:hypothetical protein